MRPDVGRIRYFWLSRCGAEIPPTDDFGSAVVFEAASDGEQGVGIGLQSAASRPTKKWDASPQYFCISTMISGTRRRPWPRPATGRCTASVLYGLTTHESKPAPPLFIVSNSRLRPSRTAHRKEERMRPLNNPALGDFRAG